MVAKKTKKQIKNNSGAFLGVAIVVVLIAVVLFIALGSNSSDGPGTSEGPSCSTICQDAGYSGAIPDSCISIVECNNPDYPLVEGSEALCSDLEVCCCQLGL